jgi:pimeloyl-ACP methyl ester carboxylesterase
MMDRMELHFELRGGGPALVFIPGLGLDLGAWDEVAEALADRFTCILLDNRGAGRSPAPPGPCTVERMTGDVEGLLDALGLERATAVGHSLGGFVALQLALDRPERVSGLALVSTAARGDLGADGARPPLARTGGPLAEVVRGNLADAAAEDFPARHPERFRRFVSARLAHPPRGRGVAGQRAAVAGFDARGRLGEVSCATAVVHGLSDRLVPALCGRELAAGIPGARFFGLEGVGHLPLLEAPGELARIIGGFG